MALKGKDREGSCEQANQRGRPSLSWIKGTSEEVQSHPESELGVEEGSGLNLDGNRDGERVVCTNLERSHGGRHCVGF